MITPPLKRWLLALTVACSAFAPVAAAGSPWKPLRSWGVFGFKSYGGDQGLTTLATTVMTQDANGFIWVGTEDGLFRYDGESFHRFDDKDGLPDNSIYALAPALDGSLWVLSKLGLSRWEGERFVAMTPASGLPKTEKLIDLGSTLACDAQSRVWIATRQGVYQGGPSGFWPVAGLPKEPTGCVWINPSTGTVLIGQVGGRLFQSRPEGGWISGMLPKPYSSRVAISMVQDTLGRIWVRGDRLLLRYDHGITAPPKDLSGVLSLKAIKDPLLFPGRQGRVWAPTESGLACFQGDDGFLLNESWGLPNNWAGSVLVDREGSLWIGSEGVQRVLGRMFWTASTRRQGLPSDTIWAIARTKDGRVWAGTQGGLAVAGPQGWQTFPGTAGLPITALQPDGNGGLWVGATPSLSERTTLRHLLPGGQLVPLILPGADRDDFIQALAHTEDGTLWVASSRGKLWRATPGGQPISVVIPKFKKRTTVFGIVARRDVVWVSTDQGLGLLDHGKWSVLDIKDGLASANCQAMAISAGGDLWLSYGDKHGLTILHKEGTTWVASQVKVPDLTSDGIVSMAFDEDGKLWLGTSRGVKRWDGQTCLRFGRGDGLPGEDADGNALWVDNKEVWFGMSNGLAHFDAVERMGNPSPPSTKMLQAVDGGGHSWPVEDGLLDVPYAFRTMDFTFAAPSYLNESAVRLQVRLQGFEDQWRDTKAREARYTALPPGYYRFEARAAIGDGPFGDPDTLDFRIIAPWWRTWWFYSLCFAALSALVLASIRWRTKFLEQKNLQLESLIKARTLDLERANDQLKESSMVDSLTGLKNRRYLGMNLPEEETRVLRAYRTLQASGKPPSGEDLVFLLVDLDHFKMVNDEHGHAAGDAVLKVVAEAIRAATRETDTVARWGGEEFLIIARRADRGTADLIARKVLDEVSARAYPTGHGTDLRLTCSVGFSAFPVVMDKPDTFGWEDVVEIADQCLYAAKRTGRNAFVGVYFEAPEVDPDIIPLLLSDLPRLVKEGKLALRTSFPHDRPLDWKQGH